MTGDTSPTESQLSNMALTDDDDDEYEEEEILVHVEFDCEVDHNMLNTSSFKLIGVDTENPLMQLDSKVYQGEWRDIVGTSVFFEDDEDRKKEVKTVDPLFEKPVENPLKLTCCTRKSLLMSRVFIKPKTDETQNDSIPENESKVETNDSSSVTEIENRSEKKTDETEKPMDVT